MAIHIVDRRLNPGSKSLENRQRFLRRAKALVQGAVKKSSQSRDIKDVLEGGEVSVPIDGMDEPRFRREGGNGQARGLSTVHQGFGPEPVGSPPPLPVRSRPMRLLSAIGSSASAPACRTSATWASVNASQLSSSQRSWAA